MASIIRYFKSPPTTISYQLHQTTLLNPEPKYRQTETRTKLSDWTGCWQGAAPKHRNWSERFKSNSNESITLSGREKGGRGWKLMTKKRKIFYDVVAGIVQVLFRDIKKRYICNGVLSDLVVYIQSVWPQLDPCCQLWPPGFKCIDSFNEIFARAPVWRIWIGVNGFGREVLTRLRMQAVSALPPNQRGPRVFFCFSVSFRNGRRSLSNRPFPVFSTAPERVGFEQVPFPQWDVCVCVADNSGGCGVGSVAPYRGHIGLSLLVAET